MARDSPAAPPRGTHYLECFALIWSVPESQRGLPNGAFHFSGQHQAVQRGAVKSRGGNKANMYMFLGRDYGTVEREYED